MSVTLQSTPRQDGFRMPGEFEPHAGCWMLWPERPDNWRLGAKPAQRAFAAVATAISQFEAVTVGVSREQFRNARRLLPPSIRVVEMSCNDAWMRDCGPTFVVNDRGEVRGIHWRFNAWGGLQGGLYFPWDLDEQVAQKVLEIERLDRYRAPIILEGGSIHVDGEGTLITTEECLLNPNRNPGLSRQEIEEVLRQYLHVDAILWLGRGLRFDETSGHVDNLCCFARPGVVVLAWTDDPSHPQYEVTHEAYERLSAARDARGRRLEIYRVPLPASVYITKEESEGVDAVEGTLPRREGDCLPASYVNCYIANGGVVVPTFDDPQDAVALERMQEIFAGREVVGVPAREILLGGGGIHCITQQQPLGIKK